MARRVVARARAYAEGQVDFVAGGEEAAAEAAAREARRAANAARRGAFVERMVAKARKQGQPDDFFLREGSAPPTPATVAEARALGKEKGKEALARWWRAQHGQHCMGHHLHGKCPHLADDRGCGFLHGDEAD